MSSIKEIWNSTKDELLNKVTWPTWEELRSSTIIVLVASIIFALAIYVMDVAFGLLTNTVYSLFG
jgi:preprotein translocase subunit SecE